MQRVSGADVSMFFLGLYTVITVVMHIYWLSYYSLLIGVFYALYMTWVADIRERLASYLVYAYTLHLGTVILAVMFSNKWWLIISMLLLISIRITIEYTTWVLSAFDCVNNMPVLIVATRIARSGGGVLENIISYVFETILGNERVLAIDKRYAGASEGVLIILTNSGRYTISYTAIDDSVELRVYKEKYMGSEKN